MDIVGGLQSDLPGSGKVAEGIPEEERLRMHVPLLPDLGHGGKGRRGPEKGSELDESFFFFLAVQGRAADLYLDRHLEHSCLSEDKWAEGDQQIRPLRHLGRRPGGHEQANQERLPTVVSDVPSRQKPRRPARGVQIHPDLEGLRRPHRRGSQTELGEVRQPRRAADDESWHRFASIPAGEGEQPPHFDILLLSHHHCRAGDVHLLLQPNQKLRCERCAHRDAAVPRLLHQRVLPREDGSGAPGGLCGEQKHSHEADGQPADQKTRWFRH
mmetsp:Transcript_142234/g.354433  ORF Transcript_142234/g.354433 Transcript_142234/m.354433 type:complete len:270 (-) Transcript_142234:1255-2064(-)